MEGSKAIAQSHMIDLPAGRFHYVSWNTEQAELPSLLLLHGLTCSTRTWRNVGPELARQYQVYALDMRGHGESIQPLPGAYSLRHIADDVAAFVEALGLVRPVLIGHSWGGSTALVLASGAGSQKPAPEFSCMILEDPALTFRCADSEHQASTFSGCSGSSTNGLPTTLAVSSSIKNGIDLAGSTNAPHRVSYEVLISILLEASQAGELSPLLARMVIPTLLIRADPSIGTALNDATWKQAQKYLPAHSCAIQIKGAAHNIHNSRLADFLRAVNDFLYREKRFCQN